MGTNTKQSSVLFNLTPSSYCICVPSFSVQFANENTCTGNRMHISTPYTANIINAVIMANKLNEETC